MNIITFILTLCVIKGMPETAASQALAYAAAAEAAAERAATYDHTLYLEELPGTVQSIAFNSKGEIQSITHNRGNIAVRTDVFTITDQTITEVRTLSTGEKLTKVTNLETLETTVTYTA